MNVDLYERALERTGRVVAGTRVDQLNDPTPCSDWDVRALLNHIIGGLVTFAEGAKGRSVSMDDGTDHVAQGYVEVYERGAKEALEAFRAPGALEATFTMPWGETPGAAVLGLAVGDAAVHGWDLATATGQEAAIDDDVAEAIYAMTTSMLEPRGRYPRRDTFGPPVDVGENASPGDRALAYLGRRP